LVGFAWVWAIVAVALKVQDVLVYIVLHCVALWRAGGEMMGMWEARKR
jgi:hypothetical protein